MELRIASILQKQKSWNPNLLVENQDFTFRTTTTRHVFHMVAPTTGKLKYFDLSTALETTTDQIVQLQLVSVPAHPGP
jgi:hypothetical protein